MLKFAIELVKGDDRTVLQLFDTKESAMAAGPLYRSRYAPTQGLIGCTSAEFDTNDQRINHFYRIHGAWT